MGIIELAKGGNRFQYSTLRIRSFVQDNLLYYYNPITNPFGIRDWVVLKFLLEIVNNSTQFSFVLFTF
jgi:hypothetical protein